MICDGEYAARPGYYRRHCSFWKEDGQWTNPIPFQDHARIGYSKGTFSYPSGSVIVSGGIKTMWSFEYLSAESQASPAFEKLNPSVNWYLERHCIVSITDDIFYLLSGVLHNQWSSTMTTIYFKANETVMNGPLYNNKSGIKSNPWLKQEEYNKIKKEN